MEEEYLDEQERSESVIQLEENLIKTDIINNLARAVNKLSTAKLDTNYPNIKSYFNAAIEALLKKVNSLVEEL